MSGTNVGGISFDVAITGISKSLRQTKDLTESLTKQNAIIRESTKAAAIKTRAGAALLKVEKRMSAFSKTSLKNIYNLNKAIRVLTGGQKAQISVLKNLHNSRLGYQRQANSESKFVHHIRTETQIISGLFNKQSNVIKSGSAQVISEIKVTQGKLAGQLGQGNAEVRAKLNERLTILKQKYKLLVNYETKIAAGSSSKFAKWSQAQDKTQQLINEGNKLYSTAKAWDRYYTAQRPKTKFAKWSSTQATISELRVIGDKLYSTATAWDNYYARMNNKAKSGFAAFSQKATKTKLASERAELFKTAVAWDNYHANIVEATRMNKVHDATRAIDKLHTAALKMNSAFDAKRIRQSQAELNRLAAAGRKATVTTVRLSKSSKKLTTDLAKQVNVWHRLKAAMSNSGYSTWWKRFGVIAIGFAVAYRAIYAFQMAVGSLSRAFLGGLVVMDDYKEGLATIAGMIALTYDGAAGYSARFIAAQELMGKSMQNAMRLAPKYRMSMEEITAGFRELAQFGVIVTPEQTEKSINTLATIKEISMSTGSVTKQLRQEIQALFQGQARVTDQFTRMIKITMPDLYRTLQDGAITSAQKWEILNDRIWDFNQAIRESNQNVKNQAMIAKNTLQIISMMAVEHSGVFGKWVKAIREFNEKLFDVKGNLLPLGQQIEETFADMWTSIDYALQTVVNLKNVIYEAYVATKSFLEPWKDIIIITTKAVVTLFVLRTVMQMTLGIATMLAGASGLGALVRLLAVDVSKSALVVGLGTLNKTLGALLVKLLLIPAAFVAGFSIGPWIYTKLAALDAFLSTFFVEMIISLSTTVTESIMGILEQIATMPFKVVMAWWESFTAQTDDLDASSEIFSNKITKMFDEGIKAAKVGGKNLGDALTKATDAATAAASAANDRNIKLYDDENLIGTKAWIKKKFGNAMSDLKGMLSFDIFSPENLESSAFLRAVQATVNSASKILGDGMNNLRDPSLYPAGADWEAKRRDIIGNSKASGMIDYKKQIIALDREQLGLTEQLNRMKNSISTKEIYKPEGLQQTIDLKRKLLESYRKELEAIKLDENGEDNTRYNAQLKVIKKLLVEIDKLQVAQDKLFEPIPEAFGNGMVEWANGLDTVAQRFNKLGQQVIPSVASGFKSLMGDVFKGEVSSFGDFWDRAMDGLVDSFANAMSAMTDIYVQEFLATVIRGMAGMGGGGTSPTAIGATGGSLATAIMNPSGTVIGMAGGGVIPEHIYGVGESGQSYEFGENGPERVLSNSDSFAQPSVNVAVNIQNNSKAQVTESSSARFDGKQMILDVVLEDYRNGGSTYRTFGR